MSLKAKFWARRLELEPHGYILSLEGWNLGLEARFWVSRLNLRLGGGRRRIVAKASDGQQYPCPA